MSSKPVVKQTMPSGAASAAFLAPTLGLLAMAIANYTQNAVAGFDQTLLKIGSWIPNYTGLGPYSGKETILLVVWLGSWAILNVTIGKNDLKVKPYTIAMVIGIGLATLLLWPPFYEILLPRK